MSEAPFYGLLVLASGRTKLPDILPEVHLNLWEKKGKGAVESAFLDIGLMLDTSDTAATFEFFFPWQISAENIEDLALRLQVKGAVAAIFNESWSCTTSNGSSGCIKDSSTNETIFTFVELLIGSDLQMKINNPDSIHAQQSISLNVEKILRKSQLSDSMASRMYVRFRVKNVPKHFYRVTITPRDTIFLSSWQRTEIIDFRMNVRRGVPAGFEQRVGATFINFKKIHLFLMKSSDQDIVFEDKLFKSCRSLEDEHFWANYSIDVDPSDDEKNQSRKNVKDSLGYQWTKTNVDGAPVSEFGTLARFKNVRFGLVKFVIVASLVGALGNIAWDVLKYLYDAPFVGAIVHGSRARSTNAEDTK